MNEEIARKILKDSSAYFDFELHEPGHVVVDGNLSLKELEAVLWWFKNP